MENVLNVLFYIPNEIRDKISNGVYEIYGGVVRDAQTKTIVKFLDPVDLNNAEVQSLLNINTGTAAAMPLVGIGILAVTAYIAYQTKKIMNKLEDIEKKIDCIGADVEVIKVLSESRLFSRLRTAFEVQNMRLPHVCNHEEKKRLLVENADAFQKIKNEFLEVLIRLSNVINIWDEDKVKQFYYYVWCYLLACEGYFKSLMEQGELEQAKKFFENDFYDGNLPFYKGFSDRIKEDKKLSGLGYSKQLGDVRVVLEKSRDILFSRKELVNLMIERNYSVDDLRQKLQMGRSNQAAIVCIG